MPQKLNYFTQIFNDISADIMLVIELEHGDFIDEKV